MQLAAQMHRCSLHSHSELIATENEKQFTATKCRNGSETVIAGRLPQFAAPVQVEEAIRLNLQRKANQVAIGRVAQFTPTAPQNGPLRGKSAAGGVPESEADPTAPEDTIGHDPAPAQHPDAVQLRRRGAECLGGRRGRAEQVRTGLGTGAGRRAETDAPVQSGPLPDDPPGG